MSDFEIYERRTSDAPTLGAGWQPLSTGPRDGTLIEVECRYGVKPWRALMRWSGDRAGIEWAEYPDFTSGPFAIGTCWWRPFAGDPASHYDPFEAIDDFDYHCGKRPILDGPTKPSVVKAARQAASTGRSWIDRLMGLADDLLRDYKRGRR